MKKLFLTFLLFIFITSCNTKNKVTDLTKIKIDLNKNKIIQLSNITDTDIDIIPLETTKNSMIGSISKVIIKDDKIYILDTYSAQSLLVFSKDGKFIKRIEKKGDAPFEYEMPADFIVTNNHIIILDNGIHLKYYDKTGGYTKQNTIPFKTSHFDKIKNNYVFIGGGTNDNLIITDNNFNKINSYFPYINTNFNKLIINPLFQVNDKLIYRHFLSDTLYKITNKLTPYKLIDYGKYSAGKVPDLKDKNKFKKYLFDKCVTRMYYESNANDYLVFVYKNNLYIYIKDKITNKTVLFNYYDLKNDVTFDNKTTYPVCTYKNKIAFVVEPNNLLEGLKNTNEKNVFLTKLKEIESKIDENSNPILVLMKFEINE